MGEQNNSAPAVISLGGHASSNQKDLTFGQTLDAFLESQTGDVQSVYLYFDNNFDPHCVVTRTEQDYDYSEVFVDHHDLRAEIDELNTQRANLKGEIKSLKRDKSVAESAFAKLAKYGGNK